VVQPVETGRAGVGPTAFVAAGQIGHGRHTALLKVASRRAPVLRTA